MDFLSKKAISYLLGVVFLLLAVWYLKVQLFPADKSVDPVLKESISLQKEALKLNKKVNESEKINAVDVIGDIPVIGLQPSEPQANESDSSSSKVTEYDQRYNQNAGRKSAEDYQNAQSDGKESEEINYIGSYSLSEQIRMDDLLRNERSCVNIEKWQSVISSGCEIICNVDALTGFEVGLSVICD